MEIDKAIRIFASFLNTSWNIVLPLLIEREYTSDESSVGDWLQASWEILVEKRVLKQYDYLEIYGDGADYNGSSSRMNDIEAVPTYTLKLYTINKAVDILNNEGIVDNTEFEFDRLVGFQNGFYTNIPLFNYVLVYDDGVERVLRLENVKFTMAKI